MGFEVRANIYKGKQFGQTSSTPVPLYAISILRYLTHPEILSRRDRTLNTLESKLNEQYTNGDTAPNDNNKPGSEFAQYVIDKWEQVLHDLRTNYDSIKAQPLDPRGKLQNIEGGIMEQTRGDPPPE